MSLAQAVATLQGVGLVANEISANPAGCSGVASGTVIVEIPGSGAYRPAGTAIEIDVCQ
jgi:beta-lactam-binding protein with PASTA domain